METSQNARRARLADELPKKARADAAASPFGHDRQIDDMQRLCTALDDEPADGLFRDLQYFVTRLRKLRAIACCLALELLP